LLRKRKRESKSVAEAKGEEEEEDWDTAGASDDGALQKKKESKKKKVATTDTGTPTNGGLLLRVTSNVKQLFMLLLRLPVLLYPVWKRLLVGYVAWISLTYTVSYAYYRGRGALSAAVCPIPIVGDSLAFCQALPPPSTPTSNILTRLIAPQDEIAKVMSRVGRDHNLSDQLEVHRFAVRELGVRVGGSKLSSKKNIKAKLEALHDHTKDTAW
jgi:hypothetical protein